MLLTHFLTEEKNTSLCFTVFAVTLDSCQEVQTFTCGATIPQTCRITFFQNSLYKVSIYQQWNILTVWHRYIVTTRI